MTSTVTESRRRLQRCKTWSSQAQISPAERSTPSSMTSGGGSLSPRTSPSVVSSFGDGGLHTPGAESSDHPLRIGPGFKWKQGEKIGSGSYGCVFKALDKETGLIFAVKKALVEDTSDEDKRYRERLEQELEIYKELHHPHVVNYLGHDYSDSHLYIYLAYVSGGSLASFLSEFGPITGRLLQIGACGMAVGLSYLHERSPPIVHRDIKGANVLVDSGFCLKLADFGCSKRDANTKSFTTMGSIPWMAPEVIQQQDGFGRKADVWSLGCTVIEMASADKPWGRDTFDNMMFALRHIALSEATPPIPGSLPRGGNEFIGSCVQRAPGDRPSAAELLKDEFIRDVPSQATAQCSSFAFRRARSF